MTMSMVVRLNKLPDTTSKRFVPLSPDTLSSAFELVTAYLERYYSCSSTSYHNVYRYALPIAVMNMYEFIFVHICIYVDYLNMYICIHYKSLIRTLQCRGRGTLNYTSQYIYILYYIIMLISLLYIGLNCHLFTI
jgi:hypothetical protein